jgi:hypothetical protein
MVIRFVDNCLLKINGTILSLRKGVVVVVFVVGGGGGGGGGVVVGVVGVAAAATSTWQTQNYLSFLDTAQSAKHSKTGTFALFCTSAMTD